ncbi:MAG: DUF2017 family protein [Ilumatobacteraceae bacterium]
MSFEPADDGLRLTIDDHSREVVIHLLGELRDELVQAKSSSITELAPHMKRLFPTAYHNDEQRNEEYRRLTHADLADSHVSAVDDAIAMLAPQRVFTRGDLERFVRAINAMRLVIGTLLDVSEDEPDEVGENDPTALQREVYDYLGWLLHSTLQHLH